MKIDSRSVALGKRLVCAVAVAGLTLTVLVSPVQLAASQPAPTPGTPGQFEIIALDPGFGQLLASDARLETISTIPGLRGEGPVWQAGRLLFSEMSRSQIIEMQLDGSWRVHAEEAGGPREPGHPTLQGPNGLAAWRNGAILVVRQGARDIGLLDRNGRARSLVADFGGRRFNSPNDVVVARDGAIWFTDPPLSLAWHPLSRPAVPGSSPTMPGRVPDQQIPFAGVFRYHNGRLAPMVTDMVTPNGIAFSPDGATLYVNNAYPDMYLRSYSVGRNGRLSRGHEIYRIPADTGWGPGVPDGMKVDVRGNVWMTGPGGIHVLSPQGRLLGRIRLPMRATNFTFGDDFRSLFIVASPNVYRLRTLVGGVVPPYTAQRVGR